MRSVSDSLCHCFLEDLLPPLSPPPFPKLPSLVYLTPITWALCCSLRGPGVSGPLHLSHGAKACPWLALAYWVRLNVPSFRSPWNTPAFTMIVRPPRLSTYSLWNLRLSVLHFPQNRDGCYPQRAGVVDIVRYSLRRPQIAAETK